MAELESIELSVPLHIFEQYWALCLSWWGGDRLASRNPDHSSCHQDKHKAPTRLHVHPLSLQDAGRHSQSFPDSVVKNHQGDCSNGQVLFFTLNLALAGIARACSLPV